MFKIGQRIKKVSGKIGLGATAVFNGEVLQPTSDSQVDGSAKLSKGVVFGTLVFNAGELVNICVSQWEPIVPDGAQPAQWEACLWQPPMKSKSKEAVTP